MPDTRSAPEQARYLLSGSRVEPKEATMVQCPACWGQGVIKQWPGDRTPERGCKYCDELGEVTEERAEAYYDRNR